jgi:hypothetical protein
MKRSVAMNSALRLVLLSIIATVGTAKAATVVKPAPAARTASAAPAAQARAEVDALIRDAAQAEKADGCEVAYLKYKQAGEKVSPLLDKARAAELQGIVANKLDKLEACYRGCQPNDRQRELLNTAKGAADSEPRRAAQITRKLLVGRSVDRCTFWSDARTFLRTLPNVADEMDQDKVDPCELSGDLAKAIEGARDAVKKERSEVAELNYDRSKLPLKMNDLAELYRNMDATRMLLFELREGLIDCESQHKPLAQDAQALRESFTLAQDMMTSTYQSQLAAVTRRIRAAESKLAEKDELLTAQIGEQERLKKSLDGLSSINEELYNDLFALSQAESVSFSVTVEGRKVDQPIEEVRALMASEKRVLETLSAKYPEYFKDGVNVEGLKRKKLVLEKLAQMMKRYGTKGDSRLGYSRALAEMNATVEMMDKAIGSRGDAKPATAAADVSGGAGSESSGAMPWFLGGGATLAVAGLTFLRMRSAGK